MADLSDILLLGDPRLYQKCLPVTSSELLKLRTRVDQMAELIVLFRKHYGAGRGIAAPQIGLMKRIIVLNIDRPQVLYNPLLTYHGERNFELWDDCMSFPNLLVKVSRYHAITVNFRDENWQEQSWTLEGSMAELMQHECDHLDGILAIDRALNSKCFRWRQAPG